jgi:hypothetical protein
MMKTWSVIKDSLLAEGFSFHHWYGHYEEPMSSKDDTLPRISPVLYALAYEDKRIIDNLVEAFCASEELAYAKAAMTVAAKADEYTELLGKLSNAATTRKSRD